MQMRTLHLPSDIQVVRVRETGSAPHVPDPKVIDVLPHTELYVSPAFFSGRNSFLRGT